MSSLEQSLYKHDITQLRTIAQLWGIDLNAKESKKAHQELSEKMLNAKLANEIIDALPRNTHNALRKLLQNNGRISWTLFERRYGKIRDMGAGKRDREKPYLNPATPTESLFYYAIISRAFFDSETGAQEFAYIPDDLFKLIHKEHESLEGKAFLGRLARPEEYKYIQLSNDFILDDLTTLLSALRLGWDAPPTPLETSPRFTREIGLATRIIISAGIQPDTVKMHLEENRAKTFDQLRVIWRKNESFNELFQVPSIICEGEWKNPVLDTRKAIFDFLAKIPRGEWWNLNSFIADIKEKSPDFQRKAGEYDAWFIRSSEDLKGFNDKNKKETSLEKTFRADLRGFEHWDEVEGALIRYFITGVLTWLGFVDLARKEKNGEIKAFRVRERKVESGKEKKAKIIITSSGKITISRFSERVARYQISRFCAWEDSKNPDEFLYQITPSSLKRAKEQGLKISHLLALLKKYASDEIPPSLGKALRRWAVNGTEARVETLAVLRLSKPEDLRALRESRANRFLGEVLSPTRGVVKNGASEKVMSALIEMGIFMEDKR